MKPCYFFFSVLLCMAWLGCTDTVEHPDAVVELDALAQASSQEEVVASVGGREISALAMRRAWQEHPELTREQVLELLVERELIFARASETQREAARASLQLARKRGLVRALLAKEVEGAPAKLEPERVEQTARAASLAHSKPRGLRVSQLVAIFPEDATPEQRAQAQSLIQALSSELGERSDLRALRTAYERHAQTPGVQLSMNQDLTFRTTDADPSLPVEKEWVNFFPEVARQVEDAFDKRGVGALTPPIKSSVGWHLILVQQEHSPRLLPGDLAAALARRDLTTQAHRKSFQAMALPLLEDASFRTFPENLEDTATQAATPTP